MYIRKCTNEVSGEVGGRSREKPRDKVRVWGARVLRCTGVSEIDGHMALFVGWNMAWFDTLIEPLREMQHNQV